MDALLAIGDFSRATHLSIKALRHYHELGLLAPARVDPRTGYRFYRSAQVEPALLIRHLRRLEMPVDEVKTVLQATDPTERNEIIVAHLKRMEELLEHTQQTVSLLRSMLDPLTAAIVVEHRSVPAVLAATITETVQLRLIDAWWTAAFAELHDALRCAGQSPAAPGGGLYTTELFAEEIGESTIFVPITKKIEPSGRVRTIEIPAAEFAIATHRGALSGAGPSYAALGKYVAERSIGAPGPICERYVEQAGSTTNDTVLTEISWPIAPPAPDRHPASRQVS